MFTLPIQRENEACSTWHQTVVGLHVYVKYLLSICIFRFVTSAGLTAYMRL